jgi:hypothetical protein
MIMGVTDLYVYKLNSTQRLENFNSLFTCVALLEAWNQYTYLRYTLFEERSSAELKGHDETVNEKVRRSLVSAISQFAVGRKDFLIFVLWALQVEERVFAFCIGVLECTIMIWPLHSVIRSFWQRSVFSGMFRWRLRALNSLYTMKVFLILQKIQF